MTKPSELYFLPLGGSGEIGMNLNLYGYKNQWLMVDLGITFVEKPGADIATPDIRYIESRIKDLKGLVVTHGHEDHIGAIPHLWSRLGCPIYATPFTAELVHRKLKEVGLDKAATVHVVPLQGRIDIGDFNIEFIDLTHSIPEPTALAIRTPAGTVLHTGDWKIDSDPLVGNNIDTNRLKEIGDEGVMALVCDSTNIFVEGRTESEAWVRNELRKLMTNISGRIIMACFASNVARLQTAMTLAKDLGRKIAFAGRSMDRFYEVGRKCGYLEAQSHVVDLREAARLDPSEAFILCTGSQGENNAALKRMALGKHPRARLRDDDTVVFSSRVIPGNEKDIHALERLLKTRGIQVYTSENASTHVSGHPAQEDLKDMYAWVRPKVLIPVHGEDAHLEAHGKFGLDQGIPHAVVPHNGTKIRLCGDQAEIVETVHSGRLILDGVTLVQDNAGHFKDRDHLSEAGHIAITLVVNKDGNLMSDPQVTLVGVCAPEAEKSFIKELDRTIRGSLKVMPTNGRLDNEVLRADVMKGLHKVLRNTRGKVPSMSTHIVRLKPKPKK
ncbi:MAG: ribonuclease J [Alphaproteobacteria bacterium]|nr:MAG: ribonuclease J [Alphaproteobacteria bacterium]